MDGTTDDLKGRAKEAAGDLTDNDDLKNEGKTDRVRQGEGHGRRPQRQGRRRDRRRERQAPQRLIAPPHRCVRAGRALARPALRVPECARFVGETRGVPVRMGRWGASAGEGAIGGSRLRGDRSTSPCLTEQRIRRHRFGVRGMGVEVVHEPSELVGSH